MTARAIELVVFAVLGLLSMVALVVALRQRSTWVAAMLVAVAICPVVVWATGHGTTFTGV